MRGYGLSLGVGTALYLFLYFVPLVGAALGFFGGILLSALALPFQGLGEEASYLPGIFGPALLAIVAHLICHRRTGLFRDSGWTIAAATWLAATAYIPHFLCDFAMRCSGRWPFVGSD